MKKYLWHNAKANRDHAQMQPRTATGNHTLNPEGIIQTNDWVLPKTAGHIFVKVEGIGLGINSWALSDFLRGDH